MILWHAVGEPSPVNFDRSICIAYRSIKVNQARSSCLPTVRRRFSVKRQHQLYKRVCCQTWAIELQDWVYLAQVYGRWRFTPNSMQYIHARYVV